ncbi:MAG: cell division protein CrgA [Propionibacteriaceae bacterium]|nr:cell division protein CrgA [Propionibacteriaceae bacterium]
MPESHVRKAAVEKRKQAAKAATAESRRANKPVAPGSRAWVLPTFITVGLLGVIWLVVYYITASLSIYIPGMSDLGGWNILIGMGLMAAAFGIATAWK